MSNIDNLTIAEAKQLAQMFGGMISPTVELKSSNKLPNEIAVIVTTQHRGVFFGYADDIEGETITLRAARNAIYWSADVKGFMGLASTGPTKGCRIGPPANIQLRNITSVMTVTDDAVEAWESAPWSK